MHNHEKQAVGADATTIVLIQAVIPQDVLEEQDDALKLGVVVEPLFHQQCRLAADVLITLDIDDDVGLDDD